MCQCHYLNVAPDADSFWGCGASLTFGYAAVQTVAWYIKAPPYPAPQAVPPENLPDHQAASGPEPNGRVAPEPDKIAVCEGNANFDMHTRHPKTKRRSI